MVEFKLTNAYSPTLFASNGYQVVVMPMLTNEANEQAKKDKEARAEQAEPTEPSGEAEPQSVTSVDLESKPKKRNRKKQAVTA